MSLFSTHSVVLFYNELLFVLNCQGCLLTSESSELAVAQLEFNYLLFQMLASVSEPVIFVDSSSQLHEQFYHLFCAPQINTLKVGKGNNKLNHVASNLELKGTFISKLHFLPNVRYCKHP